MGLSGSIRGLIGTSFVDATRPRWNSGSRRFVRHVCGLAIGASMCFCAGRVGDQCEEDVSCLQGVGHAVAQ